MKNQIVYLKTADLHPYKNNPRINADAVDAVAASIKEYGFRSPIIIDENNTIINGHCRHKAAKKLGLDEVPCIRVTDLTEEQIREYRLIDNKTAEYARWDADLLEGELVGMDFGDLGFDFDFSGDLKKKKRWQETKAACDLKDKTALHKAEDGYYQSLFKAGKTGKLLSDIKCPENVEMFAWTAVDFLTKSMGGNFSESDWCVMTTPRRRHAEGFHFATEICERIAEELRVPFYRDAAISLDRSRLDPTFEMRKWPEQKNVILYDDILTTGNTVKAIREMLYERGYTVITLIGIDNH